MMTTKMNTIRSVKPGDKLKYLICLLLISFAFSPLAKAQEAQLDRIAAIVNDDVIMLSDVRRSALRVKQSGKVNLSDDELLKQVLEKLILEKVQVQKAKEIGIKIDDVAVDEAMLSIAKQNKLDMQQFRKALIQEGFDYKVFRENIRDRLALETLKKRHQGSNEKISEAEVDDLIRSQSYALNQGVQYQLTDIMLPSPGGTSLKQFNANYNRAQILRKQLISRPNSMPAVSKKFGASVNDLGWKSSTDLSPVFARTLSTLNIGELSPVVRDARGFHILRIEAQQGGQRKQSQQVKARHILIPATDPKAKLKATQLRNKLLAGEAFAKLAKQSSADSGSAENGGELPIADPDKFVPPFAAAVKSLPLNTISQPVQTKFGWHIIEVLERKESDQTRESLKLQAQSLLNEKNKNEKLEKWLQIIRDEAYVEYRI